MRTRNKPQNKHVFLLVVFIITALYIGYTVNPLKLNFINSSASMISSYFSIPKNDKNHVVQDTGIEASAQSSLGRTVINKGQTGTPARKLIPGGKSIGVKLNIDGIFVVGFSEIQTKAGKKQSPAMLGGICIGDSLTEVDGQKLESSRHLAGIISSSAGKTLKFKLKRNNTQKIVKIKPIIGGYDYSYKAGLWVRDSTAGVGTMTFVDPKTNQFGALGHPINDIDTGLMLPVKDGSIYHSRIVSVEYGMRGKPGELKGVFSKDDIIGTLISNTNEGIFGKLKNEYIKTEKNMLLSIAGQSEVKEGPAKILASIDGINIREYNINIEKCNRQNSIGSKSMILRITDEELLKKTGGIVQGMSGSPIIQNNKLVGAVTHVFVNKPNMGYGIYIEWMLAAMDQQQDKNNQKQ